MFDREALIAACKTHGRVARVVIADVKGSAPREVGAAMLVWSGGQSGTIGGGTLEFELAQNALSLGDRMSRHALGPDMGQCCGGQVHVLSEIYDCKRAEALPDDMILRGAGEKPLALQKYLAQIRSEGIALEAKRFGTWFVEPVYKAAHDLWIWGAGHVGRALVHVMAPLSEFQITWLDTGLARFPQNPPENLRILPAQHLAEATRLAPPDAHHLILTYSHGLDLDLCHHLLQKGFGSCGLIGSNTKWARFQKRLRELGHTEAQIVRIRCPIGDPGLGKSPQMIAIGVANQILRDIAVKRLNIMDKTKGALA